MSSACAVRAQCVSNAKPGPGARSITQPRSIQGASAHDVHGVHGARAVRTDTAPICICTHDIHTTATQDALLLGISVAFGFGFGFSRIIYNIRKSHLPHVAIITNFI